MIVNHDNKKYFLFETLVYKIMFSCPFISLLKAGAKIIDNKKNRTISSYVKNIERNKYSLIHDGNVCRKEWFKYVVNSNHST